MKIAFFDAKNYDIESFRGVESDIKFKFYETKLTIDTVELARGCDGICVFVNDNVNAEVIEQLVDMDIKVIALRCAGYNNVDFAALRGRIPVVHVPAYSPYAVAECTRRISEQGTSTLALPISQALIYTVKRWASSVRVKSVKCLLIFAAASV